MTDSNLNKKIAPVFSFLTSTLIWVVLLFFIPSTVDVNWPTAFWIKQSIFLAVLIFFYHINTYIFIKKLLYQDKMLWFITVIVFSVGFTLLLMQLVEHALNLPELMHHTFRPSRRYVPRSNWFRFDFFAFLITTLVFGLSTTISLVRKGQQDALIRKELEKQKVSSELSFLKAQINPHFYFNTLNNIYALTAVNADSAREAIHQLSKMMRYVIYETEKEKTLLSQEIDFIANYIEIMKLRLTEKVTIKFEKPEKATSELIAPMIMLPFVENAFKHGVSSQQKSSICIAITMENHHLNFKVKNNVFKKQGLDFEENSGIGLSNTKRRLLLLYPDKHMLDIKNDDNAYQIELGIDLK